jgi:phosphodiesterase/alkaline phosphatase D-like protein
VSEAFGTLRYGKLLELLLWDCRRYLTLKAEVATFVPMEAERWIERRLAESDARFVVNVPSVPIGWTAGKWGEWYPDVLDDKGALTVEQSKYLWQGGWLKQHDRILTAASNAPRLPLFVCGDMHSIAEGIVSRSGEHDWSENPVVATLAGPLGTGTGWPSRARGTVARPALGLTMREEQACLEENGFSIVDVEGEQVTVRYFRWLPDRGEDAIDTLEPFRVSVFPRGGI